MVGKKYRGDCPNCGKWVSKRGSDRYTKCHRCGWKAGLPILRIVTHWPNWYLWKRRAVRWTKRGIYFSVIALILVFVIGATAGTGINPIDQTASDVADSSGVAGLLNNSTSVLINTTSTGESSINRTKIEYKTHYLINKERKERGYSRLKFNNQIQKAARYHSEDMANRSYFAHKSPKGRDFKDRYRQFGIDCSVRVSSDMRSGGAENIAYTYAYSNIQAENGEIINHHGNETEIARHLASQWMNSSGHRENILRPYWKSEGIGVAVTEIDGKTRIYATQNFC